MNCPYIESVVAAWNIKYSLSTDRSGIRCILKEDSYEAIEAIVPGPKETPYENIDFRISMEFDSHYPFRPPKAKFLTPVYHPNIDTGR